jgi:hypothetical protein
MLRQGPENQKTLDSSLHRNDGTIVTPAPSSSPRRRPGSSADVDTVMTADLDSSLRRNDEAEGCRVVIAILN